MFKNLRMVSEFSIVLLVAMATAAKAVQDESDAAPTSAYVTRMMSLDRNRDALLSKEELPGKLAELLQSHDADADGRLSPAELASGEKEAIESRDAHPSTDSSGPPGGPRKTRRGAGRSAAGAESGANRLDAEQILRFALTFDADKDGGLNSAELKQYASALAKRRAQAPHNSKGTSEPTGDRPLRHTPKDGESPKGLGADGNDGGFGDLKPPPKL